MRVRASATQAHTAALTRPLAGCVGGNLPVATAGAVAEALYTRVSEQSTGPAILQAQIEALRKICAALAQAPQVSPSPPAQCAAFTFAQVAAKETAVPLWETDLMAMCQQKLHAFVVRWGGLRGGTGVSVRQRRVRSGGTELPQGETDCDTAISRLLFTAGEVALGCTDAVGPAARPAASQHAIEG